MKKGVSRGQGSPKVPPTSACTCGCRVVEAEIIHVQRKRTVVVLLHRLPDFVDVARRPIRCHAHYFVLAFVHLKAEKRCKRAVEQPDRMRKLNLLGQLDLGAASHAASGRQPLADTINGQNRRFLKRRTKKRARRMRKMVLRERTRSRSMPNSDWSVLAIHSLSSIQPIMDSRKTFQDCG